MPLLPGPTEDEDQADKSGEEERRSGPGHNGVPENPDAASGKQDVDVSSGVTVRTDPKSRFLSRLTDTLGRIKRKESREAAESLTNDDGFETYPNRLAAETRRIRHETGGRIADGRKRDLFDDSFELMSQNAATEIRGVAPERLVAKNRAGRSAALDTYADLIARSGNAVTTDFAGNQGVTAIDSQVHDGVIDEAEAARLGQVFMADIDEKSALGFIQDDPEAAIADLALPEFYPN